ncbi:hypothetical protein ONZ45_g1856 [Pleurotus djamor]|nr:hypothetical protein ONZ45_g1856 [Pleurotus djamor]
MTSLSFAPDHPKFPSTTLLHAICAIGSLYTAAVTSPPLPDLNEVEPDELFLLRHRIKESRPDSFAEEHARLAKEFADRQESLGQDLFHVLQGLPSTIFAYTIIPTVWRLARIVLTWFYWSHSRWVEVFVTSAQALRLVTPLGLNMLPRLISITKALRPPSILPPARTVIEDEMRRNAFWLAYANERLHGFGNGWALSMDDNDVCQLLPPRADQFNQGTLVLPSERQWAQTKDLLLVHPEKQVDSFILYIKGSILISQVKTFNMRFRSRHLAGDVSVTSPYADSSDSSGHIDPRGSPAFVALDDTVSAFPTSFPPHLRSPVTDNIVDPTLYTASLMPHCANIILHDPHADVQQRGCVSALRILASARSILDLIHCLWATSFDITLLEPFCVFSWFIAGRVLVRFLKAAQDAEILEQAATLSRELDYIHYAIAKVGERIPMAFRFAKMLRDLIATQCGRIEPLSLADTTFIRGSPEMLAGPGAELLHIFEQPSDPIIPHAAHQYFGSSHNYIKQDTIADVFDALSLDVPFGVVPQENTTFGPVVETYDQLRRTIVGKDLFVIGEVTLSVQHCLLSRKGLDINDIVEVLSHEQALGQCQNFLAKHFPHATKIKMPSTGAAAEALLMPEHAKSAAICSKLCATVIEGLEVHQEGIQDVNDNFTRFYVIGKDLEPIPAEPTPTSRKALIRLGNILPNKNDSLTMLNALALKVSRIDRRPELQARPFQDNYFLEVQEEQQQSEIKQEDWEITLRKAIHRVSEVGGSPCLLGYWQC